MRDLTRRRFLQSMIGGASVVILAACSAKSGDAGGGDGAPAKGEGALIEIDGKQVAVYKGDDGQVIQLSPVCPHSGCLVQWNASDKTWDCPCHASIFEADGTRISGPASGDLDRLD